MVDIFLFTAILNLTNQSYLPHTPILNVFKAIKDRVNIKTYETAHNQVYTISYNVFLKISKNEDL